MLKGVQVTKKRPPPVYGAASSLTALERAALSRYEAIELVGSASLAAAKVHATANQDWLSRFRLDLPASKSRTAVDIPFQAAVSGALRRKGAPSCSASTRAVSLGGRSGGSACTGLLNTS